MAAGPPPTTRGSLNTGMATRLLDRLPPRGVVLSKLSWLQHHFPPLGAAPPLTHLCLAPALHTTVLFFLCYCTNLSDQTGEACSNDGSRSLGGGQQGCQADVLEWSVENPETLMCLTPCGSLAEVTWAYHRRLASSYPRAPLTHPVTSWDMFVLLGCSKSGVLPTLTPHAPHLALGHCKLERSGPWGPHSDPLR